MMLPSYRIALAVAKYLCRHLSAGIFRLVDDIVRDPSLLPVLAGLGAVETVGGVPAAPRPGAPGWWRAHDAVLDAVLYLEARGVAKYLPDVGVVNWAGRPCAPGARP
ncbi:MAG: hypothetical protein LM577_06270 [Thermoproteaceae archaeon]|nr:hypothetical protein [Thermoproteaceae archaeon]